MQYTSSKKAKESGLITCYDVEDKHYSDPIIVDIHVYNKIPDSSFVTMNGKTPIIYYSDEKHHMVSCKSIIGILKGHINKQYYWFHLNGNFKDIRNINLIKVGSDVPSFMKPKVNRINLTSIYKGVHRDKCGKWVAMLGVERKAQVIGTYHTEDEAAVGYDIALIEHIRNKYPKYYKQICDQLTFNFYNSSKKKHML